MTITRQSLPIRAYGYPAAVFDELSERWTVRPPDSLVEPVGGWGTLRVEVGAAWLVTAGVVSLDAAGEDWTVFRGLTTVVNDLRFAEPYGEIDGSLTVPGLTIFDDLSAFTLAAVDIYRVLPAHLALHYGVAEVPYWHGFVSAVEAAHGHGQLAGVTFALQGALFGEINLRAHQPIMVNDAQDVGTWLGRALDPQAYSRPLAPFHFQFDSATTGITLRHRGSRGQSVADYCDGVLALAQEGTHQWTISRAFDVDGFPQARTYYLREKSNELAGAVQQNYAVIGGYGVAMSLSVDGTEVPNVIYGEGLSGEGERWRNAVFPMLTTAAPAYPDHYPVESGDVDGDFTKPVVTQLQGQLRAGGWPDVQITGVFDAATVTALSALQEDQGVSVTGKVANDAGWDLVWSTGTGTTDLASGWFKPLSVVSAVDPYLYAADGDVTGSNPAFDEYALRVERAVSFGDGIDKARARKYAKRLTAQASAPPLMGSVSLTSDPTDEAGSARGRFDVREGSWLRVGNAAGSHVDVYVAGVQVSPEQSAAPVALTVASKPWDLLDLTTRIESRREARDDPARSFYAQRSRPNRPWRDASGWDAESGAGLIRPFSHPGGEWVKVRMVAGGYAGTIQAIDVKAVAATELCFAFFAYEPNLSTFAGMIADPLAEEPDGYGWWLHPDNEDQLEAWGLIEAWGDYGEPGGYSPGSKSAGHSVTGRVRDSLGWNFVTRGAASPFVWGVYWAVDACTISGQARILVSE